MQTLERPNSFKLPLISSSNAFGGSMLTNEVNCCACKQRRCRRRRRAAPIPGNTTAYHSCFESQAAGALYSGRIAPGPRSGSAPVADAGASSAKRSAVRAASALSKGLDGTGPAALHLEQGRLMPLPRPGSAASASGGGRFEAMPFGAKQHAERATRLGGELQTPQPAIIGALSHSKTAAQTPEPNACSAAHKASVARGRAAPPASAELDSLLR